MSDSDHPGSWTRRRFLEAVGSIGGAAAVYDAMVALGVVRAPAAAAAPLEIPEGGGSGKVIAVLGAGIAGLTAAYELQQRKSGYTVVVLEADESRAGGRSYTVRNGDKIVERHGSETWTQTCQFDKGLYLNAGPGRLPYHHTVVLGYCHELGVPLEVYVMNTRANLYRNGEWFERKAQPHRRILNDTRGWIAELLTKSVNKGSLNADLTAGERKQMLDLLATFGPLTNGKYAGSQRSGFTTQPGVTTPGAIEPPLPLVELLGSEFWLDRMYQPEDYEWQPTLFQPVGGMDMIWRKGLLPRVAPLVRFGRVVTSVRNVERGGEPKVLIRHRDGAGNEETLEADWCISTIPAWILARADNNFSKEFDAALKAVKPAPTCKVGWQANRRFWELDDEIYGGISYINHNITQMWYPSNDYFTEKGTMTGAYNYEKRAIALGNERPEERRKIAAAGARMLHGDAFGRDVPIDLGLSIAWHYVPHQEAGWADWDGVDPIHYRTLLQADGRVFVAGDQVSYLPGWQEGAMLSARYVLQKMLGREKLLLAPPITTAPHSHAMTEGGGRTRE